MRLQKEMSFDFSLKGWTHDPDIFGSKGKRKKSEGRNGETKEPVLQETCKKCFPDFVPNPANYESRSLRIFGGRVK